MRFQYYTTSFFGWILLLFSVAFLGQTQAQPINMEETWKEFLDNKKASSVSQLPEPNKREDPVSYLKYALITGNTYFCGDNLPHAEQMMKDIESIGSTTWNTIPGFDSRYEKFKSDLTAYKQLDKVWRRFRANKNSVSRDEVEQFADAGRLCEKGTLTKYYYMIAHDYLCDRDLRQARHTYDTKIKRLVATTFDPNTVEGLGPEVHKMTQYWTAMDELAPAWEAYSRTNISPGMTNKMPIYSCYIQPNIKAYLLKGMHNICEEGKLMLDKIKLLQRQSDEKIPSDILEKIDELEKRVKAIQTDMVVLNSYWKKFVSDGSTPQVGGYALAYECDREADVKAQLLMGFAQPCINGKEAIENIKRIRREFRPELSSTTAKKIKELRTIIEQSSGDVETLNAAWADFEPDGELSQTYQLDFEFCEKLAELKAHIIQGTTEQCSEGQQRLNSIDDLLIEYQIDIPAPVQNRLDALKEAVVNIGKRQKVIEQAWNYFEQNGSVNSDYEYDYEFPCNRVLDVRAALLDGYTNVCLSGQYGLDAVDKILKQYNPTLDPSTSEHIKTLRDRLTNEAKNVKHVTRVWRDFVPDNQISGPLDVPYGYCDKIAECRAYILDGTLNFCERGESRLQDIYQLREDYLLAFDDEMKAKFEQLYQMVEQGKPSTAGLRRAWKRAVASDNFYQEGHGEIEINAFYCDPIDQTKTWVLQGLMSVCNDGASFLQKIDAFKQKRGLRYDDELDYQVELLRVYVKRCK